MRLRNIFITSAVFFTTIFSMQASAQESVNYNSKYEYAVSPEDNATVFQMCNTGVITGIHYGKTDLLCLHMGRDHDSTLVTLNKNELAEHVNSAGSWSGSWSSRNGMHACPTNTVLVGIGIKKWSLSSGPQFSDNFLCLDLGFRGTPFRSSSSNKVTRRGMHACPLGSAVSGWHKNNNWLECTPQQ